MENNSSWKCSKRGCYKNECMKPANFNGIEKFFFKTSKNDITMISLQLMTNRQNEHAYLTKGRSLTFFSLHRLRSPSAQFNVHMVCDVYDHRRHSVFLYSLTLRWVQTYIPRRKRNWSCFLKSHEGTKILLYCWESIYEYWLSTGWFFSVVS